jgi:hypothetical protein
MPSSTRASESDVDHIPQASISAIAKIEDTLELLPGAEEEKQEKKVNKWHERFARDRKTKR